MNIIEKVGWRNDRLRNITLQLVKKRRLSTKFVTIRNCEKCLSCELLSFLIYGVVVLMCFKVGSFGYYLICGLRRMNTLILFGPLNIFCIFLSSKYIHFVLFVELSPLCAIVFCLYFAKMK